MEKNRTIGRRLFLYIFLGCILPYSLGLVYIFDVLQEQAESAYIRQIDGQIEKIQMLLHEGIQEPAIESAAQFSREEQTMQLVEAIGSQTITAAGQLPESSVRYLGNYYQAHRHRIDSVLIATTEGGYCLYPSFAVGRDLDPRTLAWYRNGLAQAEQSVRAEPFLMKITREPSMVLAYPLRRGGAVAGVVAMELNLQLLQQELEKVRAATDAYLMVLSQDDLIVANLMDPEWVMKTPRELLLKELIDLREKQSGLYPIHLNSKIYQMRIRVSDKNGWAVVAFADQEMIAARNQTILYKIAILYGMGILLSLLTAIVATRRITRPIAKLARGALAITTGDLKAKVDINDQDEFGFLAASFNQMASELRESFAKIKRQTEEMRKQENEFQTLVENAQDIISRLDKSMRYLYVNPVIESYIDVAAPDFIHKTNQEIGFPEEFYQPLEACYHKVFHTGNDRLLELEFPGFDGNSVYFQAHIIPEFDPHGRVETLLSVMRNITERKELEKNLARLDRLNLVGEMAAGIAHEVRNPMTTVRGYLQMMSRKAELAAYGDQFQLMIDELDRANDIISEFLALAKNKRVDLQMTNLNSIVKNLQPLIQADASIVDKMTVWELNEIPSVYADEKEVRQLILNLVRNGLEAMDAGGRLTISTWAEKGGVVLTIKDQGKGIKAEVLEKIGMPFMTTKDNGTGLGLAMCYSIAARHHAKIDIQTGNDGTSVAVRFPRGHWRHGK